MALYKLKDSEVWWADITVNGERVRFSTGEYDRAAAQKVHDRRKADQHDAPKLKGKTWGYAVMKWAQAQTRSESDLQSLAKFGLYYKDRPLLAVTEDSIRKALETFVDNEGTYNRYLNRIQAVLRLSDVDIKFTRKYDRNAEVRSWLTHEQWKNLYAELPPHQKLMAAFALNTGLRQANVLKLQWSHVDLDKRMVWIPGQVSKSGKPIGVPLNEAAYYILKRQRQLSVNPTWVFTYRGKPISEVKTAFQAACIRAGVGAIQEGKYQGFTWHGLRHTWATWHAQNGTPLEILQQLGGWGDMRMLLKHYGHHVPGLKAKFVDNLGVGE